MAYDKPDLDEVFNLTFEITREVYGQMETVPLKPGGANILVNLDNKLVNIIIIFYIWIVFLCILFLDMNLLICMLI